MDFITSLLLNFRTELTEEIHYSHDYWISAEAAELLSIARGEGGS